MASPRPRSRQRGKISSSAFLLLLWLLLPLGFGAQALLKSRPSREACWGDTCPGTHFVLRCESTLLLWIETQELVCIFFLIVAERGLQTAPTQCRSFPNAAHRSRVDRQNSPAGTQLLDVTCMGVLCVSKATVSEIPLRH